AELIDGGLYLQPRSEVLHQTAASVLTMLLGAPPYQLRRGGPGGWWILPEVELHFRGHILVQDLAGWYREDLTADDTRAMFITETPRWVCEVLSLRTKGLDRGRKMDLYRNWGVRHVWLVDPKRTSVEVFDFADG
ncbi:MAG: Uma2 family endonuclease, partial [Myxococcales bacterium]|nr:Uma2 family endonuclease [Myxococcales bacterium]